MRQTLKYPTALVLLLAVICCTEGSASPGVPDSPDSLLSVRPELSAGMGVEYLSAPDVVDYVNGLSGQFGATTRIPDFKAGVGFFGALDYPLSADWILKAEYVYLLVSYNPNIPYGSTEFTLNIQMPTLIIQRVLWDERLYNVKAGFGLGYHFASLTTKYAFVDDHLTGSGPGADLELEANTAFGDHLYAYLGADARFEFIGRLKNTSSAQTTLLTLPTVSAFSIGARLGFSYYF